MTTSILFALAVWLCVCVWIEEENIYRKNRFIFWPSARGYADFAGGAGAWKRATWVWIFFFDNFAGSYLVCWSFLKFVKLCAAVSDWSCAHVGCTHADKHNYSVWIEPSEEYILCYSRWVNRYANINSVQGYTARARLKKCCSRVYNSSFFFETLHYFVVCGKILLFGFAVCKLTLIGFVASEIFCARVLE